MKEAFEKIIERLEHIKEEGVLCEGCTYDCAEGGCESRVCDSAIEIVNQVAEEYSHVSTCYLQSPCEYQTKDIIVDVNSGWIPCSVDMPKELGRYIVTLKDGRSLEAIYDNISKRFIMYEHEVIAWQPLPKPYKPNME